MPETAVLNDLPRGLDRVILRPVVSLHPIRPRVLGNFVPFTASRWRWAAWAKRLVGSYGAAFPAWLRLEQTFHALQLWTPPATIQPAPGVNPTYAISLHLVTPIARAVTQAHLPNANPQLVTTFVERATREQAWLPAVAPPATRQGFETLVPRLLARERGQVLHEQEIVTRVLNRYTRQDAAIREAWLDTPTIPRIVNEQAARAMQAAQARQASPPQAVQAPVSPPFMAWQDAPLPPVQVERLTDQVLQSLDRRLVLARERFGKG